MEHPPSTFDTLPADADHVVISFNAKAGSGTRHDQVADLQDLLRDQGFTTEVETSLDAAAQRAAELAATGRLRAIVGAGGDGTIHELVNRIPAQAPLAMLPLGTENLLAKYHRQPRGAVPLAKMIVDGRLTVFDAGRANDRLFLLMASIGFDADIARRMHEARVGNISHWTYARPTLQAIRQYEYPRLRIEYENEGQQRSLDAAFCFIFNLPAYGVGLKFTPEADGTDGMLDFCAFRRGSFWHGLKYFTAVKLGWHRRLKDCTIAMAHSMTVQSDGPAPYQLDGDPGGWLPLKIETVPRRVTLIVPRPTA